MPGFKTLSVVEQSAEHLRRELRKGRWHGVMPGRPVLARELGVSQSTVQGALDVLEKEGLLVARGVGRRREIAGSRIHLQRELRVGVLIYDLKDQKHEDTVEIRHQLEAGGYVTVVATKSLVDLGMDVRRVAGLVKKIKADAWVVNSASREMLEWFVASGLPTFALFGRRRGLRVAGTGPDKIPAQRESLRRLVELGHRRIVMLAHEERRKPHPGEAERAFLDDLSALGVTTGPYNLPDWEDTPAGLRRCLDTLFQLTPPTAVICQVAPVFFAVQQHLANRGIVAPRDVSLICGDHDPCFNWCHPAISHISWDNSTIPRRIRKWVDSVAQGKDDRRQTFTKAEFVEGGTIGPVPTLARTPR